MALKNGNENAVFVKLHERTINGAKKLVFSKREKVEGTDEYKDGDHYTTIDGILRGATISGYEFEGQVYDKINLRVEDETEGIVYLIGANFNFATRALMNKLIFAASGGDIADSKIEINAKTDTDGFHSIFVTINKMKCKQMWANEQQPKRREFEGKGGKKEFDDKPLNDFFKRGMEMFVLPQFEAVAEQEEESEA